MERRREDQFDRIVLYGTSDRHSRDKTCRNHTSSIISLMFDACKLGSFRRTHLLCMQRRGRISLRESCCNIATCHERTGRSAQHAALCDSAALMLLQRNIWSRLDAFRRKEFNVPLRHYTICRVIKISRVPGARARLTGNFKSDLAGSY